MSVVSDLLQAIRKIVLLEDLLASRWQISKRCVKISAP